MLYFISVWTLLLMGCCGCGLGLLNSLEIRLPRQHSPFSRCGDRAIIATWLGMLAIAITLLATALFVPLSPLVGGVVFSIFLLISLRFRSTRLEILALYRHISSRQIALYFGITIALAAFFARPVGWDDSGLYHYSLIHWFAKFGTVPGLALLFPNFGFTSAWFAFGAPLNPEWWSNRTMATANGFILLVSILQLSIGLDRLIRQQAQLIDWFVAIYYSCVLSLTMSANLMPAILVSPSPDIPALLIVAITVWAIVAIETTASAERFPQSRQMVPLILAMGAVSIKLVALPLLLVTGLWFVFRAGFDGKVRHRLGIAAVLSLLLVPFLLSSVVTSGCPIYPSSAFCLDLPWTIGDNRATANSTHHWVTWYGTPPAGIHPWLWALQHWLLTAGNKFITAMIAISIGCSLYLLKTRSRISYLAPIAIAIVGIGFFLLTAPFNRFMLPYLFIVPALTVAIYCRSHFSNDSLVAKKLPVYLLKIPALLVLIIATLLTVNRVKTNYALLILPPSIEQTATMKRQVNDVTYFLPVGSSPRCWTNELPCAYNPVQIGLRDSSQGLKAGFIRK